MITNPDFDDIVEMADRLNRNSIPHYLCRDKDGWTLIIYQSTGIVFGKRAMMFSHYTGSKGSHEGLIEVYTGDKSIGEYKNEDELKEHWFTADENECYNMIMRWYRRRCDDCL